MYPKDGFYISLETLNPISKLKQFYQIEAGRDLFNFWYIGFGLSLTKIKNFPKLSKEHVILAATRSLNRRVKTAKASLKILEFYGGDEWQTIFDPIFKILKPRPVVTSQLSLFE